MKISYNPQDDILWIVWGDIEESDEKEPGMILDYDRDGRVVGVELMNASQKIHQLPSVRSIADASIANPS